MSSKKQEASAHPSVGTEVHAEVERRRSILRQAWNVMEPLRQVLSDLSKDGYGVYLELSYAERKPFEGRSNDVLKGQLGYPEESGRIKNLDIQILMDSAIFYAWRQGAQINNPDDMDSFMTFSRSNMESLAGDIWSDAFQHEIDQSEVPKFTL